MSLGKHSDYGSYLTDLKYNTLGKHLSEQHFNSIAARLDLVENTSQNEYNKKPKICIYRKHQLSRKLVSIVLLQ